MTMTLIYSVDKLWLLVCCLNLLLGMHKGMKKGYNHKQYKKKGSNFNQGLNNVGNTCAINSTLQILFAASKFKNYLIKDNKY